MIMARPNIKGRGLQESKVLAVRIKKEVAEEFERLCNKMNLDKASIIEKILFEFCCAQLKGHPADPDFIRRVFKLEIPKPIPISPRSRPEVEVKQDVNTCPVCGSTNTEMKEEGLFCFNCDKIVIPSWELRLREYFKQS